MKLTEFYALDESRVTYYTIESDGSLLMWEETSFLEEDIGDEMSYETLSLHEDESFRKLSEILDLTPKELDEVRELWSDSGAAVKVYREQGRMRLDLSK